MKDPNTIHTDVYGLEFLVKKNRICFTIRDATGKNPKRHWVDLPPQAAKNIGKVVASYIQHKEEEAKLTPDQLREKYQEMMGS